MVHHAAFTSNLKLQSIVFRWSSLYIDWGERPFTFSHCKMLQSVAVVITAWQLAVPVASCFAFCPLLRRLATNLVQTKQNYWKYPKDLGFTPKRPVCTKSSALYINHWKIGWPVCSSLLRIQNLRWIGWLAHEAHLRNLKILTPWTPWTHLDPFGPLGTPHPQVEANSAEPKVQTSAGWERSHCPA